MHEHELEKFDNNEDDDWVCNGSAMFKEGCFGGINNFGLSKGVWGWKCPDPECDFDICITCIQHSLYESPKKWWMIYLFRNWTIDQ